MRTPSPLEYPPASIRRSHRLLLKTKPLPEISEAVAAFEAAVTPYEALYDQWILARRRLLLARGEQRQAEEALDLQIRGVGLAILTICGGHRKSELLRRYFPNGYGATLGLSAAQSLPIAAGLLEAMNEEPSTLITSCCEPLITARDQLQSVAAVTQEAANELSRARAKLEEGKLAWWKAHNSFYFALRSFYSDRRSFVESLFKGTVKKRTEEEEVPDEGDTTVTLVSPQAVAPDGEPLVAEGAGSDAAA